MFNPQGSFSVQSFPLKPVQQASDGPAWSPSVQDSQTPFNSSQSAVAGSSSTGSTPSPSSSPYVVANLTAHPKNSEEEELQVIHQTAAGFAACLAADHAAVLHPDVDTPFTDVADIVNRLLPYHVFHQPVEDLGRKPSKGKEKARFHEIQREIDETRFALNCHRRLERLEDRLRRARIRSGTRPSPDEQAYVLAQSILEVERAETVSVSSDLRNARNELDAIQREKRAASSTTSTQPTVTTFRPAHYAQTTPSQYYRTYSYAYAHQYGAGAQSTSAFYSAPTAVPQTTASNTASYTPSTGPIPVQLPVTSLSALHALGIVPVPAASVPPPDQPQPAAVLKGSTSNGTMLSLDINVSLLQSAQMSGLAILLNSLMSRGTGTGAPATPTTTNSESASGQFVQNGVAPATHSLSTSTAKEKDGSG